jgi:heme exporter protein C
MAAVMLKGMLVMAIGFWLYSIVVILLRVRREIEDRERSAAWLQEARA